MFKLKFNLNFLKMNSHKQKFDKKILRKNDISILILDERWNSLFTNIEKTSEILKCEENIKDLLKEQSRLIAESKENAKKKKACMDKIMALTTEVFENGNDGAKDEMQACEKEIQRINERAGMWQEELDNIPDRIKETNLELLEHTVYAVYFKIRTNMKRVEQLGKLIEEIHSMIEQSHLKMKEYIDEKETLSDDYTDVYSYFHDLIGGEELEKLDKEYFGDA